MPQLMLSRCFTLHRGTFLVKCLIVELLVMPSFEMGLNMNMNMNMDLSPSKSDSTAAIANALVPWTKIKDRWSVAQPRSTK